MIMVANNTQLDRVIKVPSYYVQWYSNPINQIWDKLPYLKSVVQFYDKLEQSLPNVYEVIIIFSYIVNMFILYSGTILLNLVRI